MFKIRREQRDALAEHDAELFSRRLQAILLAHLPEQREDLEGPEGLARVERTVVAARERGFAGDRDASKFASLSFVLGPGFIEEPWAKAVLEDEAHETATDRAEALWEAAKDRELDRGAAETARALKG